MIHNVLQRQLKKLGLDEGSCPDPLAWALLLEAVSRAYTSADDERNRLIRSLEVSSREMRDVIAEREVARDKALDVAKAKSAFLANMSHEIRTPMNGVMGMASLLALTPLSRDQQEFVEAIEASGNAMLRVINDILDFSKIESGKFNIQASPFSALGAIEETGCLLAPLASDKGLRFVLDIDPAIGGTYLGDGTRFQQVLTNLIGNAIKFTKEGHVIIRADRGSDDFLEVTVLDTGIGIPEDRQSLIFESFTQADISTTRVYGGTGLGLTIVREIVDLMGGTLAMTSQVGVGSQFMVRLPMPTLVAPSATTKPVPNFRVCVDIEDEPTRSALVRQLRACEIKITSSHEFHHLRIVDCSDCQRNREELPSTRIIRLVNPTESAGAYDINKPVRRQQLWDAIHKLRDATQFSATTQEEEPHPLQGKRILVVEDTPVNQKVARRMLERLGATVEIASDGVEGLNQASLFHFDVILMDIHMPRMDGYETTRAIREGDRQADSHSLIIAMTASAMDGELERCLAAGMDGYISKPVSISALQEVLQHHLFPSTYAL